MPLVDQNNSSLKNTRSKRGGQVGSVTPPNNPNQIAIQNSYAYVADTNYGLRIVDISDPTDPTLVGSYFISTPQRSYAVAVKANYAYLGNWDTGRLAVFNINDPTNPTLAANYVNYTYAFMQFVVKGDYLYTSCGIGVGLVIFNISNPTNPTPVAQYPLAGGSTGIGAVGNYAYVANNGLGLLIFNVSNPASPSLVGTYSFSGAYGVAIQGNYAYVAGTTSFRIVNISNPANPSLVASYSTSNAYQVTLLGGYAILNNGLIIDVSSPASPVLAGNAALGGSTIATAGNYIYGGAFRVVKVLPAPQLGNNQLTINEGQTRTLTTVNLNASDADDGNTITFTVSNVGGGRFELSSNPGVAITRFTKQQIINGVVRFVHNGGEVAPSYNVRVGDGLITTQPVAATINYTPVNDAPVLSSTSTGAISFTENGAAVVVNSALAISDVDNANMASATVTVVGYVNGQDVLALPTNPQNGITATFNATTGVLTLTGSSSRANYQTALRSVTYRNTSENPSTAARSINIRVNDGTANSNVISRNLAIVAINDAPVLSSSNTGTLTYNENAAALVVNPNLIISDVDNTNLASARVTVVGYINDEDLLLLPTNPQNGITAAFNTNTGILTLTGSSAVANYQTALRTVRYRNTSENPSTVARSINIRVNDGTASSNVLSRNLTVVATNDAPVLSSSNTSPISVTEGAAAVKVNPNLVITDPDSANLASAIVTLVGYVNGEDVLTLPTNPQNGITAAFNTTTGALALTGSSSIANYRAALRTVTYQNTATDPSTAARSITIRVNDGIANSNILSRNITVILANDAPLLTSNDTDTLDFTESSAAVAVNPNLTITDIDSTNLASATVSLTGYVQGEDVLALPTNPQNGITADFNTNTGVLTLTGSSTLVNYQTALRSVTYQNTSGNPSTATRSIDISVNDGTANSNILSRDLTVVANNDLSVLSSSDTGTLSFTENGAAIVVNPNLTISDPDSPNLVSATVTLVGYVDGEDVLALPTNPQNGITALFDPTMGVLTLEGSSTVANYQAALRSVTYENTSENPSTAARSIEIKVNDGFGNSNVLSRNLAVVAINNAPALTSSDTDTLSFTENGEVLVVNPNLTITDIDSPNLASATITLVGYVVGEDVLVLPTNPQNGITATFNTTTGVLTLTGSSTVANYQAALQTVTYENTSENPSTTARSIETRVNDGVANSNVVSRDLTIVPINNPSVLSSNSTGVITFVTSTALPVDPNLIINDTDSTNLTSARIAIVDYGTGEEVLALPTNPQNGITATFDTDTGVLTLTGSSTVANYQAALRSVTYQNVNNNIDVSNREISFVVNDGTEDSNILTRNINLIPLNNLISGNNQEEALFCFNQESEKTVCPHVNILGGGDVILESATVTISDTTVAEDVLEFDDQANGISGNYDNNTGTLTLTGPATASDFSATLRTVKYKNNNDDTDSSIKIFTVAVNYAGQSSNTLQSQINIITVNEAPVVINPVEDFNVTVNEPFSIVLNSNTFSQPVNELTLSITENDSALTSLNFDPATRTLNGNLATVGENRFSLFASDRCNQTAASNFTVNALPAPISAPLVDDSKVTPISPTQDNTGAIVGGVIGGIAGLLILGGAIFGGLWAWRKKQAEKSTETATKPAIADKVDNNAEEMVETSGSPETETYSKSSGSSSASDDNSEESAENSASSSASRYTP